MSAGLPKRIIKVRSSPSHSPWQPRVRTGRAHTTCPRNRMRSRVLHAAGTALPITKASAEHALTDCSAIPQETQRLIADSPPGISAIPHDDNLRCAARSPADPPLPPLR